MSQISSDVVKKLRDVTGAGMMDCKKALEESGGDVEKAIVAYNMGEWREFARLNVTYTIMSKRKLLQLVEEGHVRGWDDPRIPTIKGLRRRGYTPEAIRAFCEHIGVAKRDAIPQKDPRRDAFWYRRTFTVEGTIPAIALLKIHKARYGTKVWLNGQDIGEHLPCFTPAWLDVKKSLKGSGQQNELIIRVGADRESRPTDVPSAAATGITMVATARFEANSLRSSTVTATPR